MEISLNTNTDWQSVANTALAGTSLTDSPVANVADTSDGNLAITMTRADGTTQTVTVPAPLLEDDTEETERLNEEQVAELKEKLQGTFDAYTELAQEAEAATAATEGTGTDTSSSVAKSQKTFFDIFSLIQLLAEIAAKQRETAREMRYADLSREVTDVQNRADTMRTAAKTSLIMSVCFTVASVAAQAVAAGISAKAQTTAGKMELDSGLTKAQENVSLTSVDNAVDANANLTKARGNMTDAQVAKAESHFSEAQSAKADLQRVQENRASTPEELSAAKAAYAEKLDSGTKSLDKAVTDKELEVQRLEADKSTKPADLKQAKAELKELQAERKYGKAYAVREKVEGGLTESLAKDAARAETEWNVQNMALKQNATYHKATMQAKFSEVSGSLAGQFGQALNSVTQSMYETQQAAATELEATEKTDEAARSESDDLAQSAQDLFDKVVDLMKGVYDAEAQSVKQIMA